MTLSAAQIYGYAKGAGLNSAQAVIATAVAFAESGGDPNQEYKPGTGEDSFGLWQINLDPRYRASRMAELGITSPDQLKDPATNAKAMAMISSTGTNWNPWTTYTSGKYKSFLAAAQAASGSPPLASPSGGDVAKNMNQGNTTLTGVTGTSIAQSVLGPAQQGVVDSLTKAVNFVNLPNIGLRLFSGFLGSVLFLIGIYLFAFGSK